jgi:hypothetical protein
MIERVTRLIGDEGIPVEIVSEGECAVRVVQSEGRVESDPGTLQSGGWIKCETAREMAGRLNIDTRQMGRLLDLLDVKVRECGLGCF